jgi:hypothetical protein
MFDEKIIILNAPPSAGKDEIANYLQFYYEVKKEEMKTPLFTIGAAMLGMTEEGFRERYSERGWKESVHPFIGISVRQLFINISEKMLKPMLGQQVFGKLAANRLSKADVWWQGVVFSDGGFDYELSPLINKFGSDSIYVCRLHREGCTFEGDSRSYFTDEQLEALGVTNVVDFTNDQPSVNLMCEAFIKQFKEKFCNE